MPELEEDDEEWFEESTPKSSKLIVGIAAGIAVLGVVAFLTISGNPEELADANDPVNPPVENPTTEKLSSTPKQQAKTATDIDNKLFDVVSKSALISRGNTTGETVLKKQKRF